MYTNKKFIVLLCLSASWCLSAQQDKESPSGRTFSSSKSLIAGTATGFVDTLVNHPLSVLKTRKQLQEPRPKSIKELYRGLSPNLASNASWFGVQQVLHTALSRGMHHYNSAYYPQNKELSPTQNLLAGSLAGSGTTALLMPSGCIVTQAQKQEHKDKSLAAVTTNIYKQRGLRGFFRGITPGVLQDGLYSTSALGVYPQLKKELKKHIQTDATATVATGALIGTGYAIASHPLDTIRIKMQGDSTREKYKSMLDAGKDAWKSKTLYSGFKWRLLRQISGFTLVGKLQEKVANWIKKS